MRVGSEGRQTIAWLHFSDLHMRPPQTLWGSRRVLDSSQLSAFIANISAHFRSATGEIPLDRATVILQIRSVPHAFQSRRTDG
jgi:hypothetical protein